VGVGMSMPAAATVSVSPGPDVLGNKNSLAIESCSLACVRSDSEG